ncbi:MAG TPA: response regulator transcription factor [Gaiellaceae bacterium]
MSGARILVVDDEPQILRALRTNLHGAGYDVETAATAEEALAAAAIRPPDAVVLDLILPDGSGTDVCREIRGWSPVPILVLSAVGDEREKVAALDAGADDYVTKPFAFEELLARVEALSRRPRALASPVLRVGDLEIDQATHEVRRGGIPIEVTPKEYTVLEYLARHAGRVMSRTLITEYAWGYHFDPGTNIVDVVINHLRKKVDAKHARKLISTVRGVGYVLKE